MVLFVNDLPLVSCTKCIWYTTWCVCLYSVTLVSRKNTENEELASVVHRQYDNMLNLIVLNKLLFTIYGMICWRITDFPEDILLTMDLLVSESRWQLQTAKLCK